MVGSFNTYTQLAFDGALLQRIVSETPARNLIRDSMSLLYKSLNWIGLTAPFDRFIDSSLGAIEEPRQGGGTAGRMAVRDFDHVTTEDLADYAALAPVYEKPPQWKAWPNPQVTDCEDRRRLWDELTPKPTDPVWAADRKKN
jgi:hypothetical protein